ncbi:lytic transglycosylase domain-containing protein [Microvirga massiliensis]|uniref:lytic transglycosylase domain-containing protein n=1 Tax=Microvirga massiliensis TaxID=1033741 RepID=UPI00069B09DA|nr:lytic transglycosylase domain-containing protein [Microvirga massiliensis]
MKPVVAAIASALFLHLSVPALAQSESVGHAVCRHIEAAAHGKGLPVTFFTRLIWRESSFRAGVTSPAGAQGIAQFMPGTARERGLEDPFDPEQAIPAAAGFLADLREQFGNLGLAAAAYNGGPARVAAWLRGNGGLPFETEAYVRWITGRPAEDWRPDADPPEEPAADDASCLTVLASLGKPGADEPLPGPLAPWGVQLAGNFSKQLALAAYSRASRPLRDVIGEAQPMIIGTRLRSRGTRAFYRVRVPAQTRQAAEQLCARIRARNGSCIVLPS